MQDNKITPIGKQDPGFINMLTKEFVLCDGKTLTYDNYPSANTDNPNMFKLTDKGIAERDTNGKPKAATTKTDTYTAIANSINGGSNVKTPSLLAFDQQAPRYIRGMNWKTVDGITGPIQFGSEGIHEGHFG